MKNVFKTVSIVFFIATLIVGCKKSDDNKSTTTPPPPNQESELITTVRLIFSDSANPTSVIVAEYKDADGDGGNAPSKFDSIILDANKTYTMSMLILDESKMPVDTVSGEIEEEANDHLFVYTPSGVNLSVEITDKDSNTPALPIGLESKWRTKLASTGTVQVVLRHQPGVKNGTYAPGTTDLDLTFKAKVK